MSPKEITVYSKKSDTFAAKKMNRIPMNSRPREKLISESPECLSDQELMAVILGSGIKNNNVFKLANCVLKSIEENFPEKKESIYNELLKIKGIGKSKATMVSAMLEFSRRKMFPKPIKIHSAKDAHKLLLEYSDRKQEYFFVFSLNGARELIRKKILFIGSLNRNHIEIKEIFSQAIYDKAVFLIFAHNHPSGTLEPSESDIKTTKNLIKAGELLGIQVIDHIIFSYSGCFSFFQNNLLNIK